MFTKFGREIVGLDIGGANLKAAVWSGPAEVRAASVHFPMWKMPDRLATATQQLLRELGGSTHLAVTMTGELADCFASRREGVTRILDQLCRVVPAEQISVYSVDGRWLTADQATADPWSVAASNWHALATWLAKWPPTSANFARAVLVDIGSTTVDILPMVDQQLATGARTDRDRLTSCQLIYTGIRRTPVCAVVHRLMLDGASIPVMAELFATVDDAYLQLGHIAEEPDDCDSADGKPRTRGCAAARLARMIGEDAERLTQQQLHALAAQVVDAQADIVARAIEHHLQQLFSSSERTNLVCSGHGLPLFEQTIRKLETSHRLVYLHDYVSNEVARSAPAAAVAWLRQAYPLDCILLAN